MWQYSFVMTILFIHIPFGCNLALCKMHFGICLRPPLLKQARSLLLMPEVLSFRLRSSLTLKSYVTKAGISYETCFITMCWHRQCLPRMWRQVYTLHFGRSVDEHCVWFTANEQVPVIESDHSRWTKEAGRGQLWFTLGDSWKVNNEESVVHCIFLRSEQRVLLLFVVAVPFYCPFWK